MQLAGGKQLSLSFNGAQSHLGILQPVVNASTGNSSVSMNTSQTWGDADLLALVRAATSKALSLDFNGAQTLATTLRQLISVAGASTAISVNTAQAMPSADLVSLMQLAAAKALSLAFNGAQSDSTTIQAVASVAGAGTSIGVNTAQVVPTASLVALARAAG